MPLNEFSPPGVGNWVDQFAVSRNVSTPGGAGCRRGGKVSAVVAKLQNNAVISVGQMSCQRHAKRYRQGPPFFKDQFLGLRSANSVQSQHDQREIRERSR